MFSKEIQNHDLALLAEAMNITVEGVVISDAQQPDQPIIYANEGFERLTGYRVAEVIGRNCRFLQGPGTDRAAIQKIRQALNEGTVCKVDILNYRKDGVPFWNRLSITPLRGSQGRITHFVGVQFDITELKETKLRLEKANEGLQRFHTDMSAQLAQARLAQQAVLQMDMPSSAFFRAAVRFDPFIEIGGDLYDVLRIDAQTYGFMITDVTGHGIPAALLTFMCSAAFRNSAHERYSPAEVLEETNRRLINKMPFGTYASMFYMIYHQNDRELLFAQGGHPPALLLREGDVRLLSCSGTLVGVFPPDQAHWHEVRMALQPGDKVILYTDALLEPHGHSSWEEGIDNLCSMLKKHRDKPIEEMLDLLMRQGEAAHYTDDVTLLGFEVLG